MREKRRAKRAITPQHNNWRLKASRAIKLCLVTCVEDLEDTEKFFSPVYCHQFSGEWIKGYRGLSIILFFAADSLECYVEIEWVAECPDPTQRTDLDGILKKWLIGGYTRNKEEFIEKLQKDFKIPGTVIHRFKRPSRDFPGRKDGYTFYHGNLGNQEMKDWHTRLQIFMLFFIETTSYIQEDDPIWEIGVLVKHTMANNKLYRQTCGYLTLYSFFHYPDSKILRLSQILLFPPFQRQGLGGQLVKKVYDLAEKKNYKYVFIEDPSDACQQLRDFIDLQLCVSNGFFGTDLSEMRGAQPTRKRKRRSESEVLTEDDIRKVQKKVRITRDQVIRVFECIRFDRIDPDDEDEYRLFRVGVKNRLRGGLAEEISVLNDKDPTAVNEYLRKAYSTCEKRFRSLLQKLRRSKI